MSARIGVFGGSFDPPHLGHLIAASAAATELQLDQVLWVPTGTSYHKSGTSSADHRLKMVERAIHGNPRFAVSRADTDRPGPTYSIDTVGSVQQQFPNASLFFILGDDAFVHVPTWHRAEELSERVTFAVVHRAGTEEIPSPMSVRWVRIPTIGISSTECRRRAARRQSLQYWVPSAVDEYIAAHELYSEEA